MSLILTPLERLVLFAADEEGRIPLPRGEKPALKSIRTAIAHMKKSGLVIRQQQQEPACLPYALTNSGKSVRLQIIHSHR